jgi:hypothetical protein
MRVKIPYNANAATVLEIPRHYRLLWALLHEKNPYLNDQVLFQSKKDLVHALLTKRGITEGVVTFEEYQRIFRNTIVEVSRNLCCVPLNSNRKIRVLFEEIRSVALFRVAKLCPDGGKCKECPVFEDCFNRRFLDHFNAVYPTHATVD